MMNGISEPAEPTSGFSNNTQNSINDYIKSGFILNPEKLENGKLDLFDPPKEQRIQEKSEKKGFSERANILIGFALGTTGSFLIATGISCTQALEGAVPDFELATMRGAVQFIVAVCVLLAIRHVPRVERNAMIYVFIYSSLYTGYNVTNYLSVRYIPVGLSGCVRRAAIIVTVAILARAFLKERITLLKALGMVLCITGVVLVVQPWITENDTMEQASQSSEEPPPTYNILLEKLQLILFNSQSSAQLDSSNSTKMTRGGGSTFEEEMLGYSLAFISGACLAIAIIVQKLKLLSYDATTLSFYNGLNGTIIPLIISVSTEDLVFPSDASDIGLVLGQSITSGLAALVLIQANIMMSPVVMSVVMALEVVFLLIAQHTVLKNIQPGIGNWVEYTGAVLVVLAALLPTILDVLYSYYKAPEKLGEIKYELSTFNDENENDQKP